MASQPTRNAKQQHEEHYVQQQWSQQQQPTTATTTTTHATPHTQHNNAADNRTCNRNDANTITGLLPTPVSTTTQHRTCMQYRQPPSTVRLTMRLITYSLSLRHTVSDTIAPIITTTLHTSIITKCCCTANASHNVAAAAPLGISVAAPQRYGCATKHGRCRRCIAAAPPHVAKPPLLVPKGMVVTLTQLITVTVTVAMPVACGA